MEISMSALSLNCLYSAVLGVFLGALYDAVRLIRIVFGVSSYSDKRREFSIYSKGVFNIFSRKRGKVFTSVFLAVTDLLFFFLSAVAFILFLYVFNFGIFRWFFLLFAVIGFLIYYNSVGKLFVSVSTVISSYVMLALNVTLFAVLFPFKILFHALRSLIKPLIAKIIAAIDKSKNKRYTLKCIDKLKKFTDI